MGCCCGCSDEVSSKVDPTTPENEEMAARRSDKIFVTNRSCTDLITLIILIALLGGFAFMITNSVNYGDIYRIVYGYDNCGNVCGRITPKETNPKFSCKGADFTHLPYLQMNIHANGTRTRNCVTKCNDPEHQYNNCIKKKKMNNLSCRILFLNRCIPKKVTDTVTSIIKSLGLENFYRVTISLGILIAFRYMVQWIVYIVLIGVILACIGGTTFLWMAWYNEKKELDSKDVVDKENFEEDSSLEAYFVYAIIMTIVTVITLLIVLVMRKRIALVMQLFREAGKAVYSMPALLLQPIYPFIINFNYRTKKILSFKQTYLLIGITMFVWIYCMLWIESAGIVYKDRTGIHFRKDGLMIAARWYNLFVFFVLCEFFLGCQHMVVALSVAQWFFTRDKKKLSLTVTKGFGYLVRYHLGTIAFGALIIGIVRLARAMLSFVQNRLKKFDNCFVKGILCCCQCCLWCFECALKFLTRNAYIETAIYGCNFCTGGKKAFQALSSNILRVAAINSVGDFVLFLGKVLVVVLTVIAGICLMQKKEGLQHPWVPIALAGLLAFLVSHCFISIYEVSIKPHF
ncbi:hypothetical protein M0802_009303 [Mischocyttarus mexicanus]|nr:hypothetical protein M0802_009303 [Mischocyttarus mexicanus]